MTNEFTTALKALVVTMRRCMLDAFFQRDYCLLQTLT